MARIPLLTGENLTPEQQEIYDAVVSGPRGVFQGPLRAALHRPELADRWQKLGEILRYRTSLSPRLSELAILVTARQLDCPVEWIFHEKHARKAELEPEIIEAVRKGERPDGAPEDALAIHDFAFELSRNTNVSDATYQKVLDRWGAIGAVELAALVGYYTMVAMTLNVHDFPIPEGETRPF